MAYRTTSWKNTDIGQIPKDWEVDEIGAFVKIQGGYSFKSDTFTYKGTYVIRISDINNDIIDLQDAVCVNTVVPANFLVGYGDILIAMSGATTGKIGIYNNVNPSYLNQRVGKFSIYNEKLSRSFLAQFVKSNYFKYKINGMLEAGAQPNISGKQIESIILSYPQTVEEQQKIATVLTDLDDLIAELEKVRDKKQAIKIGAMQELLTGKRRLPGFNKPWKEVELGELLTYEQPQNYIVRSEEYRKTGIPVLTAGKTFVLGYTDEIDNIFSSVPVIIFDDFTTVSKFVNFPFKVKSSAIKILKLKNIEDNLKFIFEVMQITPFNLLNHQRYWISKYSKMSIKVPEYIEQTTIANILSDMDDEISAINDKINKYKQIKAGVADELLSGRIRLIKPQE